MAQVPIIEIEGTEIQLLADELRARVRTLGLAEVQRRLGRPIDNEFFDSLVDLVPYAGGKFRFAPSPAFDRVLQALW